MKTPVVDLCTAKIQSHHVQEYWLLHVQFVWDCESTSTWFVKKSSRKAKRRRLCSYLVV